MFELIVNYFITMSNCSWVVALLVAGEVTSLEMMSTMVAMVASKDVFLSVEEDESGLGGMLRTRNESTKMI